jgi:hypothetical protein
VVRKPLYGLGLVITSLLIIIAAMIFGIIPAALSGLIFLGWAIPALAQGVGKWRSAKSEMISILEGRSGVMGEGQQQKSLTSRGAVTDSHGFAGSVTERTRASLDQRA